MAHVISCIALDGLGTVGASMPQLQTSTVPCAVGRRVLVVYPETLDLMRSLVSDLVLGPAPELTESLLSGGYERSVHGLSELGDIGAQAGQKPGFHKHSMLDQQALARLLRARDVGAVLRPHP